MKVKLLFDHPDSYREWDAWPVGDPGFLRVRSKFWIARTVDGGTMGIVRVDRELHKHELIVHRDQVQVIEP